MAQNVVINRNKRRWRVRKHRSGTWIFVIRFALSVLSPFYAELVKSSSQKALGQNIPPWSEGLTFPKKQRFSASALNLNVRQNQDESVAQLFLSFSTASFISAR